MLICQLTNCTPYQMMGYVIKTTAGKIIVIDGGGYDQSPELYRILSLWGKTVDLWFLTHNHSDHYASIMEIARNHPDITINGLWRSNCEDSRVIRSLPPTELQELKEWTSFESEIKIPLHKLQSGQNFNIDDIKINVISAENIDISENNPNNQSAVLKFSDNDFSIIFLGDLGKEGGEKLLKEHGNAIQCTAVQMAHHGQQGVGREVYEKIAAQYAFWPTPKWLWDNTPYLGGEPGKGCFSTPETAQWMQELGAINITSFDSSIVFDTKTNEVEKI